MLYKIIRYKEMKREWMVKVLMAFFTLHCSLFTAYAQDKIVNPDISYAGTHL